MVVLTILLVIGVFVTAAIYYKQLKKMEEAVRLASEQSKTMQGQLEETRKLVAQNERAVKAAEDSVKVAQDNTVYAQRAYVCVTEATMTENVFSLKIENAGNTPANDAQVVCRAEVRSGDPDPKLAAWSADHYTPIGIIAPHDFFQKLKAVDDGFGSDEQRKMQAGWKLYCYGEIGYKDVFGNWRTTFFSFSMKRNAPFIEPCIEGNEAD